MFESSSVDIMFVNLDIIFYLTFDMKTVNKKAFLTRNFVVFKLLLQHATTRVPSVEVSNQTNVVSSNTKA